MMSYETAPNSLMSITSIMTKQRQTFEYLALPEEVKIGMERGKDSANHLTRRRQKGNYWNVHAGSKPQHSKIHSPQLMRTVAREYAPISQHHCLTLISSYMWFTFFCKYENPPTAFSRLEVGNRLHL